MAERKMIYADTAVENLAEMLLMDEHEKKVVQSYVEQFMAVDAVEVVHGRWIDKYDGLYANPIYKCSVCGNSAPIEERYPVIGRVYTDWSFTNFCPNCGAKMDGERRDK